MKLGKSLIKHFMQIIEIKTGTQTHKYELRKAQHTLLRTKTIANE